MLTKLSLTDFERYMVADDCPEYPMTFVMQLLLHGSLDTVRLEKAAEMALARHPLLTANLRDGRRWTWDADRPSFHLEPDLSPSRVQEAEHEIDLAKRIGVRAWAREQGDEVEITFQFHHACCDGVGALQFIGDCLAAYDADVRGGGAPDWKPVDIELLKRRGIPRWKDVEQTLTWWESKVATVKEVGPWLVQRPTTLCSATSGGAVVPFPAIRHHSFTEQETRQLRQHAREWDATLNDLLLRDLFLVINRWNESQPLGRFEVAQINMPTNLRNAQDESLPAANVLGYAFLARHRRDLQDPKMLLTSIARDTRAIRKWNLGQRFLDGLGIANRLPTFLQRRRQTTCYATTVFSNLGDPTRRFRARFRRAEGRLLVGELVLNRLLAIPPVRYGTRAVFLAAVYGRQLSLVSRCDHRYFDAAGQQQLLDSFVSRVQESAIGS